MDNVVFFTISLDPNTHLWDIISVDPEYDTFSQRQIYGGSQFMVMQEFTDSIAKEYDKTAAFVVGDDGPDLTVVKVENAYVLHQE